MSEETKTDGVINITVTEDSFKYDTNLPIPDMVFWLEAVKATALDKSLQKPES